MASQVSGKSNRLVNFGQVLTRTTSVVPQTATTTLFTISGGRILVTGITGLITVAGTATDPVLKLTSVPTTGSTADLCAVVATFTSSAAGGILSVDGAPASAMTYSTGAGVLLDAKALVIPIGNIRLACGASNTTLSIQWTLLWTPLDDGAAVVAV